MRIKKIKYRWIKFECETCGEPIQVLKGTWEEVLCICGTFYNVEELERRHKKEKERKKESAIS